MPTISLGQEEKRDDDNRFELSTLDTFLMKKDGTLVQYFKITFEEFQQVYNALKSSGTPESSALYSIRTANVTAKIRSKTAELEMELNVLPAADGIIEIPLGMSSAFFPQASSQLIRRDNKFFYRLKAEKDKPSTIKVKALQNTRPVRQKRQLRLSLPPAVFATLQVHILDSDSVITLDQDSISSSIAPFFSGGSSMRFSGLNETSAVVTWAKRDSKSKSNLGTVISGMSLNAQIGQDDIRYEATFSVRSNDQISDLTIGLPKKAANPIAVNNGMSVSRESEGEAWGIHKLDLGRQAKSIDDIRLQWTVPRSKRTMDLVGFEVIGFEFEDGQLNVRSDENISFVLANRFNIEQQDRIVPNRHHTYQFANSVFSASVFTILDSAKDQNRVDMALKLDSKTIALDIDVPVDLTPENPAAVKVKLNGWKVQQGQDNLKLDKLLRKVEISPVFFLSENQSRRISLTMDAGNFGEKKISIPEFENLDLGRARLVVTSTEDVIARLERSENPSLEFTTQFESEVVSVGKNLVLSSQTLTPLQVKLRIEPVLPFVEGSRQLRLVESRGNFYLDSTCTIESSKEFDSFAVQFHSLVQSVRINGETTELAGMDPNQPFLITLPNPAKKIVAEFRFDLGEWNGDSKLDKQLSEFYLPRVSGTAQQTGMTREIQGRNFGKVEIESELGITTSSGLQVLPDDGWRAVRALTDGPEAGYSGGVASSLALSRSILSDEDVHVEQAWVHTSLNTEFRQDRVVVRFIPKRSVVNWQMPEGTRLVGCRLDGVPVSQIVAGNEGPLETKFDKLFDEHVIEFDLRFFHTSFENNLNVRLPKTSRVLWCKSFYWSLQLPDSHYVLNYSNELTSSYLLNWTGFFLRPTPKLSAKQLERWIGTDPQRLLDQKGNDYLFSSFGIVEDRSVYIVSKRNLVLIFGLIFVSLGCAFVSLSFMRNSIFLVSIAAGILILGMWYPIWFVQLLQIEVFVGFLFGVGFVVSRFMNWINPAKDETRIETNVPSLVLAAPDSGIEQSAETRRLSGKESEHSQ